ncbi:MAG: purine-cytosine permease family protein [Thermoleophilia bacterium]
MSQPEPASSPWHVEQRGLAPVPEAERRGNARDLFGVWFAGNLAITSVVVGAVVASFGLSLWQSLVALLGCCSFLIVGYFGLAGMRSGQPTMVLSAASFGSWGNVFPAALSWLNLVGWETVVLVIAAYALEAAYEAAFHAPASRVALVVSLAVVALAAFLVALLGHAAIVRLQTLLAYLFGGLTVVVVVLLLPKVHWHALLAAHSGPWLTGVVPAFSIVVAASGLSWVNMAADYSRYLPMKTSARRVVWATTAGAAIPVFLLMTLGVLLASAAPSLATAANPVGALEALVPSWMRVPYLLTAVGGMVSGDIMDVYSAGLSLLAARVPLPRSRTIFIDAGLSLAASLSILLVAHNVIGTFEAFLALMAGVLAPWSAVFLIDSWRWRGWGSAPAPVSAPVPPEAAVQAPAEPTRFRWRALIAWSVGIAISLAFTSTGVYSGPLAEGIFRGSSLGFLLGFGVTLVLYGGLTLAAGARGDTRG